SAIEPLDVTPWAISPRQRDTTRGVGRQTNTIKAVASLFNVVLGGIERPICPVYSGFTFSLNLCT
ncbi:hypothetical protein, partial [Paenibacillus macerans]|uniref:hypothetical protein n=1 Tax=Paenibacillus macerans TaxID=44252 RepID=UPI001D1307E7